MIVSGWPHAYRVERDKLIKLCEAERLQKNAHHQMLLDTRLENARLRELLKSMKEFL